ncbi:MAG TPA: hypothetical protein VFB89_13495 [Gemmatimonadales bacterium]|nr:hypothetical protein [Gemmatimonadales bacterium]
MMGRVRWFTIVGPLGLALAACGGDTTAPPPNPPTITLSVNQVAFAAPQGGAASPPQTVAVGNGGGGLLSDLTVGPITYGSASGWLTANLDKTIAPTTLTLTANPGGLASGSYTATVPVASASAGNTPQTITVALLVLSGNETTTISAAGGSTVFLDSPNLGTQLTVQGGNQFLIAVVNTAATASGTEDFRLAGALIVEGAAATQPAAARPATRYVPPESPRIPTFAASQSVVVQRPLLERLAQNHLTALERNRELYARRGNPRDARARISALSGRRAPVAAAMSTTIGVVNKVYVSKGLGGDCTDVDSIGARTVAVGQHIIVLADTNRTTWPQADRPDSSFYQTFADEYDQITWPHLMANIGDPLAFDPNLSGVGKVTLTITPLLNSIGGGLLAFVNGCDFFPFASTGPDADFSNFTEMFYSMVPSSSTFSVVNWEKQLRATAAHETKHIVSFADRILNNSPAFEEIWLEEGLAQVSSEIWMRHFNQATWKGNADFRQTVGCELHLGPSAPCNSQNDKPLDLVISHLPFLFEYLQKESDTHNEGLGQDLASDYGAGWSFARWTIDQYATDEGTFIKGLINEPSLIGVANLSSHSGQPGSLLLTFWNMATGIYNIPSYTPADPRITTPSFNFPEIFNVGQTQLTCGGTPCGLFTQSGEPVFPVQPIAISGAFNQSVQGLRGTSAAFFLLSAASSGKQALQLQSGGGGTLSPSSSLRVGIIRVH